MFQKLRNKIIIITMAITTLVLIAAGCLIMMFSSTMRPEPVNLPTPKIVEAEFDDQELKLFIKNDRTEGNTRLLATLLSVGVGVELIVFIVTYYLSERIVTPVKDSYEKQKMFIANASHELKTPLAVIEANMEALEVDKASEPWKENIETEITHANKLVLDLLQLARMDVGSVEKSEVSEVDLNAVICEQIEIFKPKFEGKISFEKKAENVKRELVRQDFVQVLSILLDNATKYGEKKIKVILNDEGLIVENDGAIVAKEDLEKIFDRFYQTDKTREGSGLGLAIAKALCEQNGWKISCESGEGVTRFVVRW